jgi:hypothetical protein
MQSNQFVCTWAQDERPADLHMAQPNVCGAVYLKLSSGANADSSYAQRLQDKTAKHH